MKIAAVAIAAAGLLAAGAVPRQAAEDLMKKYGLHGVPLQSTRRSSAPPTTKSRQSTRATRARPRSSTEKVKKGGSGVWGPVPMPPNPAVSDADLKTMVTYILALKK